MTVECQHDSYGLCGGPYIDLSVMPRTGDPRYETPEEIVGARVLAEHKGPMHSLVRGIRTTSGAPKEATATQ
jgi:hypothetical protein